jgi:hypothetical protein
LSFSPSLLVSIPLSPAEVGALYFLRRIFSHFLLRQSQNLVSSESRLSRKKEESKKKKKKKKNFLFSTFFGALARAPRRQSRIFRDPIFAEKNGGAAEQRTAWGQCYDSWKTKSAKNWRKN